MLFRSLKLSTEMVYSFSYSEGMVFAKKCLLFSVIILFCFPSLSLAELSTAVRVADRPTTLISKMVAMANSWRSAFTTRLRHPRILIVELGSNGRKIGERGQRAVVGRVACSVGKYCGGVRMGAFMQILNLRLQ